MSPAESESKKPVEKEIRTDCQKTYHHRSVAFTDRVERRRQYFQGRVGNEADCIKLQRTCSLLRHFGSEPSVLVNHTDDWRSQNRQSDRRWNRKQEGEPHSTSQDRAKLGRVSESGALRDQRKSDGADCDSENSQGQLHQAKRDVEPTHRPISKTGRKTTVDEDIHLHGARGDHCRSH